MEIVDFTGIFELSGVFRENPGYGELARTFVVMSKKTMTEGLLSHEDDLESMESGLMRKLMEMVVDGVDPEIITETGKSFIRNINHYLAEILACVEFTLLSHGSRDYERKSGLYCSGKDIGPYAELVNMIREQVDIFLAGKGNPAPPAGMYANIIETALSGLEMDLEQEMIRNYINTVLYTNRKYNEMILSGVYAVQAGYNPHVMKEFMYSSAGLMQWYDDADEFIKSPGDTQDEDASDTPGSVSAGEILALHNDNAFGWKFTDETLKKSGITDKTAKLYGGKGTVMSGNSLVAGRNGDLVVSNSTISVLPVYVINGDVCLSTGSIVFPGSIVVKGHVRKGFDVKSGGNVYIHGSVEEGASAEAEGKVVIVE